MRIVVQMLYVVTIPPYFRIIVTAVDVGNTTLSDEANVKYEIRSKLVLLLVEHPMQRGSQTSYGRES